MNKSDFYYDLPKELIAQTPLEPRDSSRLLIYDSKTEEINHKQFFDIYDQLNRGDVLVVNNTKVIPARLFGTREGFTGEVEVLMLKRINYTQWQCITKPAKKLKIGTKIIFSSQLSATVVNFADEGIRTLNFEFEGVFEDILDRLGNMPLPPYITQRLQDKSRYQTVYSKYDGSAAAPTAGLHFTPQLIEKLKSKGVEYVEVLLHVGLGTFRPVKLDNIFDHKMHSEHYEITKEACDVINRAKAEARRIICVGTTSVRVLESAANTKGILAPSVGETDIFIYPSYKFRVVDALITNFHLPESTLIMLVSALIGREKTLEIYNIAVEQKYRFFSFGDAMFLKQ